MKIKTVRHWGIVGYDEFGRSIPGEFFTTETDHPMQHPNITQQTTVAPAPAPAPLQAAPQPAMWQPSPGGWQQPTQSRANWFPVAAAMIGICSFFGFLATLSQVSELQAANSSQSQRISSLEAQIRERDIVIQSYERMAAIVK